MNDCVALPILSYLDIENKYCRICGCELITGVNQTDYVKLHYNNLCNTHFAEIKRKNRFNKITHPTHDSERIIEEMKAARMKKILQMKNINKYCKCCGILLINGQNIKEYFFGNKYYICNNCYLKQIKERKLAKLQNYINHRRHQKLLHQFSEFFPLYTIRMVDI